MTRHQLIETLETRSLLSAAGTAFNITLNFTGGLTATQQSAFTVAAQRWESILTGDLPDVGSIDDITISASGVAIDGVGKVLGSAGPSGLRSNFLPYSGSMRFDSADLTSMETNGLLVDVITHEMGHVLGVGTLWTRFSGLVINPNTVNWAYTGINAVREYQAMAGDVGLTSVPVENVGGAGTVGGHWRDSVFNNELMTGIINFGSNPLSRLTAASMIDLGYPAVNVDAAQTYTRSNDIPVIGSFTGDLTVSANSPFSLGVASATDANGVAAVRFYRESNTIPGLQASGSIAGDTLLATTDSVAAQVAGLAEGSYTIYARATDPFGLVSNTQTTTLTVAATPALPGDLNGDGSVDFSDLLVIAQNFGQSARTYAQGNVDGSADGSVDFEDLLLLSQNYGRSLFSDQLITSAGGGSRRTSRFG